MKGAPAEADSGAVDPGRRRQCGADTALEASGPVVQLLKHLDSGAFRSSSTSQAHVTINMQMAEAYIASILVPSFCNIKVLCLYTVSSISLGPRVERTCQKLPDRFAAVCDPLL